MPCVWRGRTKSPTTRALTLPCGWNTVTQATVRRKDEIPRLCVLLQQAQQAMQLALATVATRWPGQARGPPPDPDSV